MNISKNRPEYEICESCKKEFEYGDEIYIIQEGLFGTSQWYPEIFITKKDKYYHRNCVRTEKV